MATAAASPITAAQIQGYESPYTQAVVDATQNQFNNQNAQQQQGVLSNAAAQGALGGNRVGITQANLANQQQLAQAPVIAGLENQGYQTGLNTALTEQQAQAAGAYSLGNLGVSGQNAALTGANAQVGAGSLEQQTQQAQLAAAYQQFINQQAFPYQQSQWLAGIDSGLGSQMGGTSTTTAPPPNQLGQIAGLGTAAVGTLGGTGAFGTAGWLAPALMGLASGGAAVSHGVAPDDNTVPESHDTLIAQQRQLIAGHRRVQMFPNGTQELSVPHGMGRVKVGGGVFHYNPKEIDAERIKHLSGQGHENELLDLGPISKHEVLARYHRGEHPLAVVERQPDGTEVRAAAGTHMTAHHQIAAMHRTKSPGNSVGVEDIRDVLAHRRKRAWGGRVSHYDTGGGVAGAPYGAGPMPYAGGNGFVPTMGLAHGNNMPKPPGAPVQPDLAKQAQQIGSLAKIINGAPQQSSGVNPIVPGATNVTGLNYDTSGNAIPTPTFGVDGAYRGGRIGGYASGGVANLPMHNTIVMPRGYDDGGGVAYYPPVQDFGDDSLPDIGDSLTQRPALPNVLLGGGPMPTPIRRPNPDMPTSTAGIAPSGTEISNWSGRSPTTFDRSFKGNPNDRYAMTLPNDVVGLGPSTNASVDAALPGPTGQSSAPPWMSGIAPGITPSGGDMPLTKGIDPVNGVAGAWGAPEASAPPLSPAINVATPPGGPSAGVGAPSNTVDFLHDRATGRAVGRAGDLNPNFADRLQAAIRAGEEATGHTAKVLDYGRTKEEQAQAYHNYLTGQGGLAAPPGQSRHQYGEAADLSSGPVRDWLRKTSDDGRTNAEKYGLQFLPGHAGQIDQGHIQLAKGEGAPNNNGVVRNPDGDSTVPPNASLADYRIPGTSDIPAARGVAPPSNSGIDWSPNSKLWPALMSAGFGMMASRSPFAGVAVGEGGLQGMSTYTHANEFEQGQKMKQSQIDLEVKKLAQHADQAQATLAESTRQHTGTLDESKRQHDIQMAKLGVPSGYRLNAQGQLEPISGGPADPEHVKALAIVRMDARSGESGYDPDTIKRTASMYNIMGPSALGQAGRDPALMQKIREEATRQDLEAGISPEQRSHLQQQYKATGVGLGAEARTGGNREANLNLILRATDAAIPAAIEASEKVWRTGWVPINQIIQKGEIIASNPELKEFGMANLQLAEHWARAMNPTGVMRESDRDKALGFLSTADSPETYKRAVMQLQKQIARERDSVRAERATGAPGGTTAPTSAPTPAAAPVAQSAENQKALAWANANPNDPRAAAIKQKLGVQ
jgi:hypothetical protein